MRCRLPAAAAEPVLSKSLSEVTVATELDELMPLSAEPDTSATHDDCKETEQLNTGLRPNNTGLMACS